MSPSTTFRVRLDKERFTFCAAHFITYGDNVCEPLHGHNYHVTAEVEGPLEPNAYVVDFIAVRDLLTELTRRLDHRVLLPTRHPTIAVTATDREVTAQFEGRRWVFPAGDCVLLPVANTTAELLAEHLAVELRRELASRHGFSATRLGVTVDECEGQSATCELRS